MKPRAVKSITLKWEFRSIADQLSRTQLLRKENHNEQWNWNIYNRPVSLPHTFWKYFRLDSYHHFTNHEGQAYIQIHEVIYDCPDNNRHVNCRVFDGYCNGIRQRTSINDSCAASVSEVDK